MISKFNKKSSIFVLLISLVSYSCLFSSHQPYPIRSDPKPFESYFPPIGRPPLTRQQQREQGDALMRQAFPKLSKSQSATRFPHKPEEVKNLTILRIHK